MSLEKRAISTSVTCSVKMLTQRPLKMVANGPIVSVHPLDAHVSGAPGSVSSLGIVSAFWGGGTVKIEGGQTAQAPYEGLLYNILYSWSPNGGSTAIYFDDNTSTFYCEHPVYACIYFPPQTVNHAVYLYSAHTKSFVDDSNPNGIAITGGCVIAKLAPIGNMLLNDMPFQIQTCDVSPPLISSPDEGTFSRYKVHTETILTSEGEWIKPKDFDSESYDSESAYGDGMRGPDKDGSWVKKEHIIEEGFISEKDGTSIVRYEFPKVFGIDAIGEEYTTKITKSPNFGGVDVELFDKSEELVNTRQAMYDAEEDPQNTDIPSKGE